MGYTKMFYKEARLRSCRKSRDPHGKTAKLFWTNTASQSPCAAADRPVAGNVAVNSNVERGALNTIAARRLPSSVW
jgi:hypothetical protein